MASVLNGIGHILFIQKKYIEAADTLQRGTQNTTRVTIYLIILSMVFHSQ